MKCMMQLITTMLMQPNMGAMELVEPVNVSVRPSSYEAVHGD